MKRIYLLMTLALGLSTAASAQRSVDLQLIPTYPTNGLVAVSEDEDPDMQDEAWLKNDIQWEFKNVGPDNILSTDSMYLKIGVVNQYIVLYLTSDVTPGSSVFWPGSGGNLALDLTYDASAITESTMESATICDSAHVIDAAGMPVSDPDMSNNAPCTSVNLNYWFLAVGDVNKAEGFSMFPNPANNTLNLVSTFNSAKNATVVIRDVVGKTVFTQNLGTNLNGQQKFNLDIHNLASGMYIVSLNVDGNVITRQIAVQK